MACRRAVTTAWNRALPQYEDVGRNYWRRFLCRTTRPATRGVQCADALRPPSVALPWTEYCGFAARLPSECNFSSDMK